MPSPQTAGNLNAVIIGWNDTVAAVSSVTDTEGNTYVPALPVVTGTALSQVIYYAKNIAGDGGTPNQITVTFNQAAQSPDVHILEYSGLDVSNPVDAVAADGGRSCRGRCHSVNQCCWCWARLQPLEYYDER
jgi:hypothetical protein